MFREPHSLSIFTPKMKLIQEKLKEIARFFSTIEFNPSKGIGLLSGSSGIALFLFYYSRFYDDKFFEEKAMDILESTVEQITANEIHTFCNGISGFCWSIHHLLKHKFLHEENSELIEPFDNYLCRNIIAELSVGNIDFLHGAVGTANYLLKRIENNKVRDTISEILNQLNQQKICLDKSSCWKYIRDYETNEKIINISLSHGLSGTCIFLSNAYKAGINQALTKELSESSIEFLLNQEITTPDRHSMFPTFALNNDSMVDLWSRLGWCYGDLGVAFAIWHYSQTFNDKTLENKAIEIFLHSAQRRNLKKNSISDAGICHGTAGLALIFRRIYLNTKMEIFKSTSEYWLKKTLRISVQENGFTGFTDSEGNFNPNLLEGIAGIGLVLLSFATDTEPIWDECLLLS